MRILVVHPRMSIMGGGERVAIHSMLAPLSMGHEVSLLSEEFDIRKFEDFFGCEGLFRRINHLAFPEFRPFVGRAFLLYQRLCYYQNQFRRILSRDDHFDLILGTQDVGYTPRTSSRIVQYCYFPEYFRHLQSRPRSPIWRLYYGPARLFYRSKVRRIGKFLSVSDFTKEYIRQIWGRDSVTLYPPCPIEQYRSSNINRENLAITIGRIVSEKRMTLFAEMARMMPETHFVIIGSVASEKDPYYSLLKRNAPDNFSIVLSPLRKARDILSRAKVYVHCAENEHFGITIVEAMAAGCVPIVHDSGGPREIVSPDVGFRWTTTREAVHQISRIMNEDSLQEEFSAASEKRSRVYSIQAFEASLIQILRAYGA